ncbi:MAG: histidine phosphatase family protein [Clostridia bacterium]|nr:histidine phosphatase family protein [Clostridia bacterium]
MRILIIRHGDPDYSIDSLTEKGWREAEILSHRLEKMKIDDFYCSPLGRAQDTAKPTLRKIGKTAVILPWLEEWRDNLGNKTLVVGKKEFHKPWDVPPQIWTTDDKFFDKECWYEANFTSEGNSGKIHDETRNGLDELLLRYGYKREGMYYRCDNNKDITIALFCHFGIGASVVGMLMGISPGVMMNAFFLAPTSVTTIVSSEVEKGVVSFRCLQMGDTSHLYTEGEPISLSGLLPETYDPDSRRSIR